MPKNQWPDDDRFERFVAQHWDGAWGDRRQELVFIGIEMDEISIRKALDDCLVPANGFAPEECTGMIDPFPAWGERHFEAA